MPIRSIVLSVTLFFLTPLTSVPAEFPDVIELSANNNDHTTVSIHLQKTGEADRKFLFFPIYKMAHYLKLPYTEKVNIHESQSPRSVRLIFQRKISGQRIRGDFLELLQERCSKEQWSKIEISAKAYAAPFAQGDVFKGDQFTLQWTPDLGLISSFNGKTLSRIQDPLFAEILWSVWTGPNAVVDSKALLGPYFRQ